MVLAPSGLSCWMMCISDMTEWETPLQRDEQNRLQMRQDTDKSNWFFSHHPTSSYPNPCPVAQLAPSSSPPILSASAPRFSSAALNLYRPDAWMEHLGWGGIKWDIKKHTGLSFSGYFRWCSHMESSAVMFLLAPVVELSSFSRSLSAAWAALSSSEKLWLLTFWAPSPPFLEASCRQKFQLNSTCMQTSPFSEKRSPIQALNISR